MYCEGGASEVCAVLLACCFLFVVVFVPNHDSLSLSPSVHLFLCLGLLVLFLSTIGWGKTLALFSSVLFCCHCVGMEPSVRFPLFFSCRICCVFVFCVVLFSAVMRSHDSFISLFVSLCPLGVDGW